jgi:predicted DNA-binding transcriptional regulator YafY
MRADRLVATLLLLQARGLLTAAELADELEISIATARRDLEALSTAGIPVYPQRGRGGGWSLLGDARTDLSGLSFFEMQALFLIIGPAGAVSPDAKSALRKLVAALPETFRDQAEAAAKAVVVDAARWGDAEPPPTELLSTLRSAVVARRMITMRYAGRERSQVREVQPWGLVDKNRVWYLIAETPAGRRTFRLDRMSDVAITDIAFALPPDFDLSEAWAEITAELEVRRSRTSADVTLPDALVTTFAHVLGARHVEHLGDAGNGRARLRVTSNTPGMLARQVAGWAPEIDVLGPPSVRTELAEIGRNLADRYAD